MEITGVGEAAQFIQVSLAGTESVLKLSGSFVAWNLEQIKALMMFIFHGIEKIKHHQRQLAKGEVSIDKLFSYCNKNRERVAVMQIDERLTDDFIKFCNDNKLTYSFLVDGNKQDGKCEVMYRSGQSAAFEAFIVSHYPLATSYSFGEYVNNMRPEDILAVEQELSSEAKMNIDNSIQSEDLEGFSYTTQHIDVKDITINTGLIEAETQDAYKTRVPGMYGDNVGYIWIEKNNSRIIHDGKTIHTFLWQNESYTIYDDNNNIKGEMLGKDLYEHHYAEVSIQQREQKSGVPSSKVTDKFAKITLSSADITDYNNEYMRVHLGDYQGNSFYTDVKFANCYRVPDSQEMIIDLNKDKVNVCFSAKMENNEMRYDYQTAEVVNLVTEHKKNMKIEAARKEISGEPNKVARFVFKDKNSNVIKADFARQNQKGNPNIIPRAKPMGKTK